jgi:protein phosphatase
VRHFLTDPPASALTSQQQLDDVLDMDDVLGKRIISTPLHHNLTIREENAIAALEVMSRFAANPKWLIDRSIYRQPCLRQRRQRPPTCWNIPPKPLSTIAARESRA